MAGRNSKARSDIKFLTSPKIGRREKKFCRFRKHGIKYIDFLDETYLMAFLNEQGKILPRRLTGNSLKYQRRVAQAIKRARHIAILPYVTDLLK